jgi:hypothetical protein
MKKENEGGSFDRGETSFQQGRINASNPLV